MGKLGLVGLGLTLASCVAPAAHEPAAHATFGVLDRPLELPSGTWTSPWIAGPFAFDQLLPSWNVRQIEEAAFRVELQVRAAADQAPTPWLDLGGWGEWPADERAPTEAQGVRVEVDLLKADSDLASARLRVRTAGPVALDSISLCFTRSGALSGLMPEGKSRQVAPLPVPQRRQTDENADLAPRICSPTAVSMLLAYRGAKRPTAEVAAQLYDAQHDIYGNWNRAVQGAFRLGVRGHLTRINDWNEVADWLAGGTPVIASIGVKPGQLRGAPYTETAGHLLVICGLDGTGQALVLDPAVPSAERGPRSYALDDLDDLDQVWLRRGGFAYILGEAATSAASKRGN